MNFIGIMGGMKDAFHYFSPSPKRAKTDVHYDNAQNEAGQISATIEVGDESETQSKTIKFLVEKIFEYAKDLCDKTLIDGLEFLLTKVEHDQIECTKRLLLFIKMCYTAQKVSEKHKIFNTLSELYETLISTCTTVVGAKRKQEGQQLEWETAISNALRFQDDAYFFVDIRKWLFEAVDEWLYSDINTSAKIFWLKAAAGMGKTVFAMKFCEQLAKRNELLGKLFFRFNDFNDNSNPAVALKNLILQEIIPRYPAIKQKWLPILENLTTEKESISYLFEECFVKIIEDLLERRLLSCEKPMVIVIDALDECRCNNQNNNSREKLLSVLTSHKMPHFIKLFVTGRPEPDILLALQNFSVTIDEEDSRHQADLRKYIAISVQRLFDRIGWDKAKENTCCELLYEKSECKFLYATMVVERLMKQKGPTMNLNQFISCLSELPKGLDEYYFITFQKILNEGRNETKAKRMLFFQLMIVGREPLSENLTRIIVDLDHDCYNDVWESLIQTVKPLFRLVEDNSGDGKKSKRFYPFHKSVVDWVLSQNRNGKELLVDTSNGIMTICLCFFHHLEVSWKEEGIHHETNIRKHKLERLKIEFFSTKVQDIRSNELTMYAFQHFTYFVLQSSSMKNQWHYIVHKFWTSLPILQMLFACLQPNQVFRILTEAIEILNKKELYNDITQDLKQIQWLANFLSPAGQQIECWYREIPQQILIRFHRYHSDRFNHLREEALKYVRTNGGWEYLSGPLIMSDDIGHFTQSHNHVTCLVQLKDGRLVSSCTNKKIYIHNLHTHLREIELDGHLGIVRSLTTLGDNRLASGADDSNICIWDTDRKCHLKTCKGHTHSVNSLVSLPDSLIASGSSDCTIRIWNTESGTCNILLEGHEKGIVSLLFLEKKGLLVSGSKDKTVRVWNIHNSEMQILPGHSESVTVLAALNDGRVVSGSRDKTLRIWNVEGGKDCIILEGHEGYVKCVNVLKDGRLISVCGSSIRIWNMENFKSTEVLKKHHLSGTISQLIVLNDGRLISSLLDRTVRIIDLDAEHVEFSGHVKCIHSFAYLGDNRVLSAGSDNKILIWDANTRECRTEIEGKLNWIKQLTVLCDGRLISGSMRGNIKIWNLEKSNEKIPLAEKFFENKENLKKLIVMGNGRVCCVFSDTIYVWDDNFQLYKCFKNPGCCVNCLVDLQNQLLASGSNDNIIRIWNIETSSCEKELEGHHHSVTALEKLQDGRLVSGSYDNSIRIWDIVSGKCTIVIEGHSKGIYTLAILSAGRIASGSTDRSIKLWDITGGNTSRCVGELKGHRGAVTVVVAVKDNMLASGSRDGAIRLWDTNSNCTTHVLNAHKGGIETLTLLPDGHLASGSRDGTIRIWNITTAIGQCEEILKEEGEDSDILWNGDVDLRYIEESPVHDIPLYIGHNSNASCRFTINNSNTQVCLSHLHTMQWFRVHEKNEGDLQQDDRTEIAISRRVAEN